MDPLNHPCFIHVECFSVKHRAGHWCSVTRLSALFTSGPKTVETVEAVGALNFDQKFTSTTSTGSSLWCGQWFLERPVLRRIFIHLEVKQNAAAWAQRLKDSKASQCKTSLETFRMFFLIHFDVCFFLAFSSFLLNWIFWISSEALYSLPSEVFVHSWRVTVLQGSAAVQKPQSLGIFKCWQCWSLENVCGLILQVLHDSIVFVVSFFHNWQAHLVWLDPSLASMALLECERPKVVHRNSRVSKDRIHQISLMFILIQGREGWHCCSGNR